MTAMVVIKSCSYDGIDVDVDGGDRKRKVHCQHEANNDDGDNDQTDCDDADGGGGNSKDNGDEDGALIGKVAMRLMMVMSKLSVLQVALLNAVEVPKWK